MSEVDDLYGKLLSRPPSIRLLEVLPATDPSHGISCKLRRYALEYTPAYKALSYAWKEHRGVQQAGGELDARREGRIEITNVPTPRNSFPVSLSLVLAIKRQRSTRNSVFLWIDAICINQADDNERTDQVTLMGIIYQRASEVIIWLGEREPEDELGEWLQGQYLLAVQYFDWGVPRRAEELVDRYITRYCMLRDEYHERDEYHGLNNPKTDIYGAFCLLWLLSQGSDSTHVVFYHDTSVFSDDTSITTQSFTRALTEGRFRADWAAQVTKGLRAIMARSWWDRVWVVQETVLARKATVVYGTLSAPWKMFAKAAINVSKQLSGQDYDQKLFREQFCAPGANSRHHSGTGDALDEFSAIVLSIESTRREHRALSSIQLLSLIRRFRIRKATDPRDKVFALHGLATAHVSLPLSIDYTMTMREVFTMTTLHVIENTCSLSILHGNTTHASTDNVRSSRDLSIASLGTAAEAGTSHGGLPSWVVDWSLPPSDSAMELERLSRLDHYSAGDPYDYVCIHGHDVLETRGYIVGTVASVADLVPSSTLERLRQAIISWHTWWSTNTSHPGAIANSSIFYAAACGSLLHTSAAEAAFQERHERESGTPARNYGYHKSDSATIFRACKTWLADTTSKRYRRTTMFGDVIMNNFREDEFTTWEKNSYLHSVRSASSSRKVFTFQNHTAADESRCQLPQHTAIGVGPIAVQDGDLIYVPDGSKVPLIIRASKHGPEHTGNVGSQRISTIVHGKRTLGAQGDRAISTCSEVHTLHQLVGDAYVHGFMDGEASSDPRRYRKSSVYLC